jgi:hypothetical protein
MNTAATLLPYNYIEYIMGKWFVEEEKIFFEPQQLLVLVSRRPTIIMSKLRDSYFVIPNF